MGATKDESRYCMSLGMGLDLEQAKNFFENSSGAIKPKLSKESIALVENYLASLPKDMERYEKLERLFSQISFRQGSVALAEVASNKNNVYVYEFTPNAQADYSGSYHGA